MDLDLLKTFLTLSKTQHFGRAAESLFITQSAVSARIRLLENQLGHLLFQRTKKSVELTQEGEAFIQHANAILEQWQQAKMNLGQLHSHTEDLRISAPDLLCQTRFADIINTLPQLRQFYGYSHSHLKSVAEQKEKQLVIAEKNSVATHCQRQPLVNLDLYAVYNEKFQNSDTMQYIHLPWSPQFELFIERQNLEQKTICSTNQLNTAYALLVNTPSFVYLPVIFQVQSEHLVLNKLDRMPPFTLSLTAYFAQASHTDDNFKAAFSQLQQDLIACLDE